MDNSEFVYKPLTNEHDDAVRKMVKLFMDEEPMTKMFNVTESDKLIFINTVIKTTIPENLSFGVFKKETDELLGCVINASGKNRLSPTTYDIHTYKASPNMEALMRFDEYVEGDIEEFVGSNNYLMFEIAIIKPQYQGMKFMRRLHDLGELVAVSRDFDAIAATATSFKSQQTVAKRGFSIIKKIIYKDYVDKVMNNRPLYNMREEKALLNLKKLKTSKL